MEGVLGRGMRLALAWPLWRHGLILELVRASLGWRGSRSARKTYWAWRVQTAYGSASHEISTDDMIAYLMWRRRQRKTSR